MVRAAVSGIAGRMGTRIAQLIGETDGIALTAGFEHESHPAVGEDLSRVLGGKPTGRIIAGSIEDVLEEVDVVIDFTMPAASLRHLEMAASRGKAMVIGTTGFSREQVAQIRQPASKIPCVLAPNMSMGVNVLFKLVGDAAKLLGSGFDVEIIEAHHRFKKDAPSGTAVKLAQVAADALGRDLEASGVYARHGIIGERTETEIGIQTIRAGDIVGEHTVIFGGMGERIEITHKAHSRDNFARGAIRAALWVVNQSPGLYDMQHVLGIR